MDSEKVDGNVHSVILSLERSHRLNFVKLLSKSHHAIVLEMVQPNQADIIAVKVVEKPRVGEENIWRNLNHPNVVPLIDMVDMGHGKAFFMPMVGENMQELLEKKHFNKQSGGFRRVKRCLYDILNGLNYLHQRGLLHGSLELTNVLVAEDGRAILCGLSLLTPSRWAPRSDRNSLYVDSQREQMKNGKEVDMWCFGCMALEVFTGKSLGEFFQDPEQHSKTMMAFLSKVNDSSLISKLLMEAYPEELLSDAEIHECWMFLHHLLVPRGKLRMNAEKALTHSFFSPVKSSDDTSEHTSAFDEYLSGSEPHLEIHRSLAYSDVCYLRNTGSIRLSLENSREKFTSMESEDPHLPVVEEGKDPSLGCSDFSLNRHQDLCDNDLPNPDCGYFSLASKLRDINMSTKDNSGIEVKIEEVSPGATGRFTVESDSLKENCLGRSSLKRAIFSIGEETEETSSTKALLPEQEDDDCEIEITEIIESEIPETEECQGTVDKVVCDEEVVEIFPRHEDAVESFVESGDLRKRNSEEWRRSETGDASEEASGRDSTSKTRFDIPSSTSNKFCSDNSNLLDETKPQSYDQREMAPSDSLLNLAMLSFFSEQSMRRLRHYNHLGYEDTEKSYHDYKSSKVDNTTLENSSLISRMNNLAVNTDIALANCNECSTDANSEEDTAVGKKVDEDAYSMGWKMAQTKNDPMSLKRGKKNNGEKLSLTEFQRRGNIDSVNGQSGETVSIEKKLAWQNSETKSDSMDYTSSIVQRKPHNYKTLGVKIYDEVWEVSPKRDDDLEKASTDPKSPKKIPDQERALLHAEGDGRKYCAGDTSDNRPCDRSGKQGDKKKEIGDFPGKDEFKDPGDKENDIEKDESPLLESIVSPTSATHGGCTGKRHLQWNFSMPYRAKTNTVAPEYPLPGSVGDSLIGLRNGEILPKMSARLLRSEEPEVLTVDSVSDPEQQGINNKMRLDRAQSDKELAKRSRDGVATDSGSYYSRESYLSHPVHRILSSPTTSPKNGRKSDTDHPKEEFELKQCVRRDDCEVLSFVREEPHNPLDKEFRKKFPVKDVDGKSSSRRKPKLKRRMRRFALRCLCCLC